MATLPASYNQDGVPREGYTSPRGKVLSAELQALQPLYLSGSSGSLPFY